MVSLPNFFNSNNFQEHIAIPYLQERVQKIKLTSALNTIFHLVGVYVAKLEISIPIKETGRSITRMIKQFDKETGRVGAII